MSKQNERYDNLLIKAKTAYTFRYIYRHSACIKNIIHPLESQRSKLYADQFCTARQMAIDTTSCVWHFIDSRVWMEGIITLKKSLFVLIHNQNESYVTFVRTFLYSNEKNSSWFIRQHFRLTLSMTNVFLDHNGLNLVIDLETLVKEV